MRRILCTLLLPLLAAAAPPAGALEADPALIAAWPRTDFARRRIDLGEILPGGPPKDGIPAIDRPRFEAVAEAASWLEREEPVIALVIGGEARAYPLQVLIWHEIVNDTVAGVPVAVTFCPLCNASIVFDRRVGGEVLDFGTTGLLRRSDLVMYDRQSESWWQQLTGEAIVGRYTGAVLRQLPSAVVAFADFAAAHPRGRVLSRRTGFRRPYGRNPYRGYDRIGNQPFLLRDPADPRLPAMERVLAVSLGGVHRLYPERVLRERAVIEDEVGGEPVVIFAGRSARSALDAEAIARARAVPVAAAYSARLGGRRLHFEAVGPGRYRDRETTSLWDLFGRAVAGPLAGRRLAPAPGGVHFAFAWLAFYPESEIYGR
ncbi:DUF3179 domain-containing protein [Inmirania thermothiophila]|uniref:Uncharacterized protein DUF3179 n=1 Tax=Inmirania thermothiophila TaxID=1750597 RepID=A0A3N1Y7X2_9GAMM|nr:DUF3179 domain-containing protein [Inmirania thermothiophila]ROR34608.1 uncharacterized protein DUF3179 [Inmirania thermothiophila]